MRNYVYIGHEFDNNNGGSDDDGDFDVNAGVDVDDDDDVEENKLVPCFSLPVKKSSPLSIPLVIDAVVRFSLARKNVFIIL